MGIAPSVITDSVVAAAGVLKYAYDLLNSIIELFSHPPQQQIYRARNQPQIVHQARTSHGIDSINFYNFGFAGHVKTGKSSMINAVRGLKNNAPNAAKVGVVETTYHMQYYTYDQISYVRLYDIPGSGTLSHQSATYFDDQALYAFDCLLIFCQNTLGEEEVNYARLAKKHGQAVCFVRSKCDMDVEVDNGEIAQQAVSTCLNHLQAAFQHEIRNMVSDLQNVPIFFVSAKSMYALMQKNANYLFQESRLLAFIRDKSAQNKRGAF